jgi:mono/diheme cytochrome c family protein
MRIAAILVLYVLCVAATSRAAVTYRNEIAPILLEHCAPCHCPGQPGPFPLLTYEDARRHAREIAVVTRRRYMPPWLPQPGYGEFVNQRRLSDRQLGCATARLKDRLRTVHRRRPSPRIGNWGHQTL